MNEASVKTEVCPGCDLRRTIYEFIAGAVRMMYCAVCRARRPNLRSIRAALTSNLQ
jgi:NMD protein affecting ribosome stability and mRNA decay